MTFRIYDIPPAGFLTSSELPLLINSMSLEPEIHKHDKIREKKNSDFLRKASQAITLGTNLAVGMGLFTFLGYYADKNLGGGFFWTLCGMGLGLVYGAYEIWKVIRLLNSADDDDKDNKGNAPGEL